MERVHCHLCGGVIREGAPIEYRPPRASAQFALPRDGPCGCAPAVVYEDPPILEAPEEPGAGP